MGGDDDFGIEHFLDPERFGDDEGAGIELRFAEPVRVSFGHTSTQAVYPVEYLIRQLKVALPAHWDRGDSVLLKYEIIPSATQGEPH